MLKSLASPRYILLTLLVLAAMAVMIGLGIWQLDRRQQRLARNADIVAKLAQPPQSLNDAAAGLWQVPDDRSEIRNTRAGATGQFDFGHQVVLLQQLHEGQPGMHLVTPLVLKGTSQAILVDRGWIPEQEASDLSRFDGPAGQATVTGLLQPSQILFGRAAENAESSQAEAPKDQWYRVDIAAIQDQMPYELLPVYLLESPPVEGNLVPPIRVEPEFDLSEGPHLGYALQWFAFAAIAGIIYLRVLQTRGRKQGEAGSPPVSNPQVASPVQEVHRA